MAVGWPGARFRVGLILLLLLTFAELPLQAQGGTASAAGQGERPSGAAPAKPARIITDVSGFHLERKRVPPNEASVSSRGKKPVLVLCAPADGVALSTHPLFEWRVPDGDGGKLTFTLVNASGDVLVESEVNGSRLRYPEDAAALLPGKSYGWKVSGSGLDQVPDFVSFEVREGAARAEVQRRAEAATDPLARAQVFLRNGLWYDTVGALRDGLRAEPARKDLAEQLDAVYREVAPACAGAR